MGQERYIRQQLEDHEISLAEQVGQHVLVDDEVLDLLSQQVISGANVLEIGSGPGNLTSKLAERASRVVGIEIDWRFAPVLEKLQAISPNLEVVYRDALAVNFEKIMGSGRDEDWQIFSNLPFHISEPFLKKVAGLPVENVVLVVGDTLARLMQIDSPNSSEFSRTSLLSQTFFDTSAIAEIDKDSFYPPPRTHATAVVLIPREREEFQSNPRLAVQRNLFLTEHKSLTIGKVIKETHDNFRSSGSVKSYRPIRRRARQELRQLLREVRGGGLNEHDNFERRNVNRDDSLGLSERILSTPFARLNNQEVRDLAKAFQSKFGQ